MLGVSYNFFTNCANFCLEVFVSKFNPKFQCDKLDSKIFKKASPKFKQKYKMDFGVNTFRVKKILLLVLEI